MKKYTPLDGLRWSRNSDSALNNMPQTDVLGRAGGGNFEASKLAYTRNVLNKGRLSLFVGIMMAVLFVFSIVGCTPYHDPDSPRSPEPENGTSASDSTKNEPGNGSLGVDTEYEDTIYYEF